MDSQGQKPNVFPVIMVCRMDNGDFKAMVDLNLDDIDGDGNSATEAILTDLMRKDPRLRDMIVKIAGEFAGIAPGQGRTINVLDFLNKDKKLS